MKSRHLTCRLLLAGALGLLLVTFSSSAPPGGWQQRGTPTTYPYNRCIANQGPCFGTGACEKAFPNPIFNCDGTLGQSLQRQDWKAYGNCYIDVQYTCQTFPETDCSYVFVYSDDACTYKLCEKVVWIANVCW